MHTRTSYDLHFHCLLLQRLSQYATILTTSHTEIALVATASSSIHLVAQNLEQRFLTKNQLIKWWCQLLWQNDAQFFHKSHTFKPTFWVTSWNRMEIDNVSWNPSKFLRIVQEFFETEIQKILRTVNSCLLWWINGNGIIDMDMKRGQQQQRHKNEFISVSSDQPGSTTHNWKAKIKSKDKATLTDFKLQVWFWSWHLKVLNNFSDLQHRSRGN